MESLEKSETENSTSCLGSKTRPSDLPNYLTQYIRWKMGPDSNVILTFYFCYRYHRRVQLVIVNTRVALIRCFKGVCRAEIQYVPRTRGLRGCLYAHFPHDDVIRWKHYPRYWPFVQSPVTGEFPSQRPVTRNFDFFFDLLLNKRLSKQSKRCWVETPWRSLWRHCNDISECPLAFKMFLTILNTTGIPSYLFT